jgi:hypothetical protein
MILVTPGLYACATGVEIEKWGGMALKVTMQSFGSR